MTRVAARRPSEPGDSGESGESGESGAIGDTGDTGNIADASIIQVDAVAVALGVDAETGLSAQEAASRLAQGGPNELRASPPVPAWSPFPVSSSVSTGPRMCSPPCALERSSPC